MKKLTPFLNYATETLESLKKCKFKVKKNKTGGFSVFIKSIVAVGPLPTEAYANAIATEFNDFVKIRIELITDALRITEEKIKDVLTDSEKDVGDAISYYADEFVRGDSVTASKGEVDDPLVTKRGEKIFVHGGGSGGDGKKDYEYEKGIICPTDAKIVFDPKFTKRGMQIPQEIDNIETPKVDKK